MQKNKQCILIVWLIVALFITGCNGSDNGDTIILANGSSPRDFALDPYSIEEAETVQDTLQLTVSYAGGCEEHQFGLVAYSYFLDSFPVQAQVLLTHDAYGDACEALLTETLVFDLSPLKEEYQRLYPDETGGSIVLRLLDPKTAGHLSVEYVF